MKEKRKLTVPKIPQCLHGCITCYVGKGPVYTHSILKSQIKQFEHVNAVLDPNTKANHLRNTNKFQRDFLFCLT